jgi:PD-(D/E)XK nuclease superfamily
MSVAENSRENYLRVTNILYPFSGLAKIDRDVVSKAAERGTKVHKICEAIALGLGEIGVDDETWGYVTSFKKWWESGVQVKQMERRFWDDELSLTGQVDFIIETEDGLAIVDLKTSSKPSKTWPAQGAAYAYLAKKAGYDIKKIFFIHLNKHGKPPKVIEYPIDDSFFLAIFRVFKHFFQEE